MGTAFDNRKYFSHVCDFGTNVGCLEKIIFWIIFTRLINHFVIIFLQSEHPLFYANWFLERQIVKDEFRRIIFSYNCEWSSIYVKMKMKACPSPCKSLPLCLKMPLFSGQENFAGIENGGNMTMWISLCENNSQGQYPTRNSVPLHGSKYDTTTSLGRLFFNLLKVPLTTPKVGLCEKL